MRVIKRNGTFESVSFDKVLQRIEKFCTDLTFIDPHSVAQKVCSRIFDGVKTTELDELTAQLCSSMITDHPDYGKLASRIIISNHHKNTSPSFSETMQILYNVKDINGEPMPLISQELWDIVEANKEKLNSYIDYDRDYTFDFFGFKTLERSYLLRKNDKIIERPQHLFMRVALGIHKTDIKDALATYDGMSKKLYTHATPTLFNAGTPMPSLISCFLLGMDDSIEGIFETAKRSAAISKGAGGIGIHAHSIRSKGSRIKSTNGVSSGLTPFLRVFNELAKAVDQAGKRKGSIAIYLEPWHADIETFLQLRRNTGGNAEEKCLDLFTALWIPSLFFKKVEENADWCLFCPNEVGDELVDAYGDDFDKLYHQLEAAGKYKKKINAQKLFMDMIKSSIETGTPYMCCKEAAQKSNQRNLGTIRSSNLCVSPETMILTDKGYFEIQTLHGQEVNVWNGDQFSKTTVCQTGKMQKLLTIKFDNGCHVRCTPYHKFYIETSKRPAFKSIVQTVEAKDLTLGMRIIRHSLPTINIKNELTLKYPYTQGLFAAYGTYSKTTADQKHKCTYKQDSTGFCKRHQNNVAVYTDDGLTCCAESCSDRPILYLYGEKKNLLKYVDWDYTNTSESSDRINVYIPQDVSDKFLVPINYNIETKLRWLEGYLDGDGCELSLNGIKNIQATSINNKFIMDVFYLLQTLGVKANVSKMQEARIKSMPNGRGGVEDYQCKEIWRINIDSSGVIHLIELGFSPKRLNLKDARMPQYANNKFTRVSSIEDTDEYDDTYCFNEPIKHAGIFNGMLLGNCAEILEFSNGTDCIASCNLASMVLSSYVKYSYDENNVKTAWFDFEGLHTMVQNVVKNLNKVIDATMYPHKAAEITNKRNRPLGLGVQGLGDTFILMRMPFDSPEAATLNKQIFETMYHAAMTESMLISKKRCESPHQHVFTEEELLLKKYPGSYVTFENSPTSKGILQFDMWGFDPGNSRYDWNQLKTDIQTHGLRNSLLIALMPTASTSQIMGSVAEMFEPITSNIYQRRTLAGEFVVVNKYLINDLINLGLWNTEMKNKIILGDGSVKHITEIPADIRALYKTAYEIKQKTILDMSADRSVYVCQSSSQNLYFSESSIDKISNAILYAWKLGLKTLIYYARVQTKAKITSFSIDATTVSQHQIQNSNIVSNIQPISQTHEEAVMVCRRDNPEGCMMCSS